ncbi:MAG: lysophospholipid acyltransferase family protein [Imperialibacter sp.]|uniref:lysophospholipid acyltransferase family protein n=1 Tax=Imperialibacter sp. TaxID=2038411 RepID=UPI0032EFCF48
MKLFFNRLYVGYALLVFSITFLILFPWFLLGIYYPSTSRVVLKVNYWWAIVYFFLIGLPIGEEWRFKRDGRQNYIFCSNHFSYLDIPVMGFVHSPCVFVGKSSIAKVPLFGFMFRKLHIMVDRERARSRAEVYKRAAIALDEGKSVIIFPEGGIKVLHSPKMTPFKDGAFRMAIEKQIPIVPVTIPYNWIILPDDNRFVIRFKRPKIVLHEPIDTKGMTIDRVNELKDECFKVIDEELRSRFPEEFAKETT